MSIAGFYGVNNIGDEAILTAMIEQFSSIPEVRLHVLALQPKFVRNIYKINSSNCMWHRNPLTFMKATSTCDLFILGGGELIHDYSIYRHPIFGVFFSKVLQKKQCLLDFILLSKWRTYADRLVNALFNAIYNRSVTSFLTVDMLMPRVLRTRMPQGQNIC